MTRYLHALLIWWRARPRLFGVYKKETQVAWTGTMEFRCLWRDHDKRIQVVPEVEG